MVALTLIHLADRPVYKVGKRPTDIEGMIAEASRAAQGVARAIKALPTAHQKNAAEGVIAALMPLIKQTAAGIKKGYPEFNPDEARDQGGQWTSGGASAPREITIEGKGGLKRNKIAAIIANELRSRGVPAGPRGTVISSVERANARIGLPSRDTVETMQKIWFALFLSAIVIAVGSVAVPMAVDSLGRSIGEALKVFM